MGRAAGEPQIKWHIKHYRYIIEKWYKNIWDLNKIEYEWFGFGIHVLFPVQNENENTQISELLILQTY